VGVQASLRHHPLIDEALFPNLTSLLIEECNKINILFSHSTLSSLEHLQKLEVRHCKNMEEIISNQEDIEATNDKIMFRALQHLLLKELPNLKAFFEGHYNLDFPSLKKVCIEDCPNMEVFSRGDSDTPRLEDFNIKIESLSSNYIQRKDINSVIRGFKSFVSLIPQNISCLQVNYYFLNCPHICSIINNCSILSDHLDNHICFTGGITRIRDVTYASTCQRTHFKSL